MRHGKKFNHLGRTAPHRRAMLANMSCSLIQNKRINTTVAKAKALRGFVEPLITKSKNDSTHSRRVVFSYLNDKETVAELFRDVAPKVEGRAGGYTRIIRTGNRLGDNAEMCMMELVDFNELYSNEKSTAKTTSRRSRRSRRGSGTTKVASEANSTETAETETKSATATASKPKSTTAKKEASKSPAPKKAEAKKETPTKAEVKKDPSKKEDDTSEKKD